MWKQNWERHPSPFFLTPMLMQALTRTTNELKWYDWRARGMSCTDLLPPYFPFRQMMLDWQTAGKSLIIDKLLSQGGKSIIARVCRAAAKKLAAENRRLTFCFSWWWCADEVIKAKRIYSITFSRLKNRINTSAYSPKAKWSNADHLPFPAISPLTSDLHKSCLPPN